jgi:hypothetical protein
LLALGEGDTATQVSISRYTAALRRWIALLRSALGRTAENLPVFAWAPLPHGSATRSGYDVVSSAFAALAASPADNFHIALGNAADAVARAGNTALIDAATSLRFARRMAYAVGRKLVDLGIADSGGSQLIPGLGPRATGITIINTTTTDVTIAHDVPDASLAVLGAGATGAGWEVMDNTTARAVSAVAVQNNTTLRLTHAARTGTGAQLAVSYCRYGQRIGAGDFVVDRWSLRGWPAGYDMDAAARLPNADWKTDIPLQEATLLPLMGA